MLLGEFQHNLDDKGRLIIPAKFREELGNQFIITRGLDGCLFGYSSTSWQGLQEKLKNLPLTKKNARSFTRMLYSGASEVDIDKQGRINVPKNLQAYAKLEKECLVIGVSDRIEIWSKKAWDDFATQAEDDFEDIAEDLLDFEVDL